MKITLLNQTIKKYLSQKLTMVQCPVGLRDEFHALADQSHIEMKRLVTEALIIGYERITKKYKH